MPLSEYEQRLLDQLEQQLNADDPYFVSSMMGVSQPAKQPLKLRSLLLVGLFLLAGLALVLLGVSAKLILLSVLGFVLAVAGVYWAISAKGDARSANSRSADSRSTDSLDSAGYSARGYRGGNPLTSAKKNKFMAGLEEKWDQRRFGA